MPARHNSIDRRRALKSVITAAAAINFARHSAAARAPESKMQLGLVTYLWGKDMTLPELLESCSAAGLTGVELRTEHKHAVEPKLTQAERVEVMKRFSDSPVELVGYGSNCEFHSDDPAKVKANIEQAKQYIQLMHDCGGSGVKVKPNGFAKGMNREKTIEQIGKALNEIAEYGEGFGQKIRVEVHGSGTSELPVMRDIFRIADHPNVGICWNSNDEDLKGAGLDANFKMVQDRLGDTVHVRELDQGDYPYAKLMKLFSAIDYQGWILLEARTDPKDKVAAMQVQRNVFEEMLK
jgi:sugar phosphate isomerase/epimerase